ncbi:unnamed protein product [Effrenium voratum]|uniref:Phosphatidate phosphatase APP1 catalytic domain-containing protein n=1 Tax=Effrenium voratum TaxID=2562239 RepID=A0AA36N567_9DINO|nr:unnamed protein product [Effrenium voratum]
MVRRRHAWLSASLLLYSASSSFCNWRSFAPSQVRLRGKPEPVVEPAAWEKVAQTAADVFGDTSEFFVDTLSAAFQGQEELVAENESASKLLGEVPGESLATLQEAVRTQSQSVSIFLEQASSLSIAPAEFTSALGLVRRSSIDVEDKVADVLGEALPTSQEVLAPKKGRYGLAVHDAAARTGADGWVVPVRAWIYRRNEQRHRIRMTLARKIMMEMIHGIKNVSKEGLRRYEERGRLIFRTLAFRGGERNVGLAIKFDGEDKWREMPPTNGKGRVEVDVPLPVHLVDAASEGGILNFTVLLPEDKSRKIEAISARASALLIPPEGVLVISDIDDTVKVTEVFLGKDSVVRNTFLEEFRPVSGMVNLYRSWAEEFGAAFAFVSNSPPELQEPLREFLVNSGFPKAPVFLRPLGGSKEERANFKEMQISELLRQYPRKKVVLVGDSGERDPIVCAELLRRHPVQVIKVLIRQVSPDMLVDKEIFAGIPEDRWQVFSDPAEAGLPDELRDLASVPGFLSFAASLGSKAIKGAAAGLEDTPVAANS